MARPLRWMLLTSWKRPWRRGALRPPFAATPPLRRRAGEAWNCADARFTDRAGRGNRYGFAARRGGRFPETEVPLQGPSAPRIGATGGFVPACPAALNGPTGPSPARDTMALSGNRVDCRRPCRGRKEKEASRPGRGCRGARKPGFVSGFTAFRPSSPPTTIPLRRRLPAACSSLPGSRDGAGRTVGGEPPSFPMWPCSGWGLPCRPCHHGRGGLLPHRFTLTLPLSGRGGLFSVALSLALRPVGVTHHPALWSPDFPRGRTVARLAAARAPLRGPL